MDKIPYLATQGTECIVEDEGLMWVDEEICDRVYKTTDLDDLDDLVQYLGYIQESSPPGRRTEVRARVLGSAVEGIAALRYARKLLGKNGEEDETK